MLNPRFPAPVNTYNPTVHALVERGLDALEPTSCRTRVRADGCGSRSIIIGGRSTNTGKGYVQYEIFGGGAGRARGKDGASGTTVNQSNAKIAPIEIIESEFPTRLQRFELIQDSGGAGQVPRRSRASSGNMKCSTTTRASPSARPNTPSRPRASTAAWMARPDTAS